MAADAPNTPKWIVTSGILAIAVAVVWLGAPILPAVLGAVGAALLLYYRSRPKP
jgi:Flp pilus assembly protein TadB